MAHGFSVMMPSLLLLQKEKFTFEVGKGTDLQQAAFRVHFSISLQKRADLWEISTEHTITSYNKIKHKPSYQGWFLLLWSSERSIKWPLDQCDFVSVMSIQPGLCGYIRLKLAEHREKEFLLQATSEYKEGLSFEQV
ncbi:rCG63658 [Rattus norvegicus]|uniref:Ac2-032 n=2 Tax=Rattus norvegicus TaxID=10116 RepID=A6IX77_RAT|nr:uncharacterized protein LOC100910150 [Rattus norvegicus]AAP86258.1 Ac2-032 [Rattus norvegicus]EDM14508.1 rCG63658 [Rattus norvegicus]